MMGDNSRLYHWIEESMNCFSALFGGFSELPSSSIDKERPIRARLLGPVESMYLLRQDRK
jgi:hypothetical protein